MLFAKFLKIPAKYEALDDDEAFKKNGGNVWAHSAILISRWVKKAEMIPWDKIEEKYAKQTGELSSAHLLTVPSSKVNSPTNTKHQ